MLIKAPFGNGKEGGADNLIDNLAIVPLFNESVKARFKIFSLVFLVNVLHELFRSSFGG